MPDNLAPIIDRHAARVLLLDKHNRVLLFRCQEPGAGRAFWITPGGGLEEGESHEQAAARELHEETGLANADIGPCVWTRSHTFPWLGKTYRQHERFFLVRIDQHEVNTAAHTQDEQLVLIQHRWWSADDVLAARHEHFAPSKLGKYLRQLLLDLPETPIDVGA